MGARAICGVGELPGGHSETTRDRHRGGDLVVKAWRAARRFRPAGTPVAQRCDRYGVGVRRCSSWIQAHGRTTRLLYRKNSEINVALSSRAEVEERLRQQELVEDFIRRWTLDAGKAFIAASWPFNDGGEFEALVEDHLRVLLLKRLGADTVAEAGRIIPGRPIAVWRRSNRSTSRSSSVAREPEMNCVSCSPGRHRVEWRSFW